jgi:hypothetical protein
MAAATAAKFVVPVATTAVELNVDGNSSCTPDLIRGLQMAAASDGLKRTTGDIIYE